MAIPCRGRSPANRALDLQQSAGSQRKAQSLRRCSVSLSHLRFGPAVPWEERDEQQGTPTASPTETAREPDYQANRGDSFPRDLRPQRRPGCERSRCRAGELAPVKQTPRLAPCLRNGLGDGSKSWMTLPSGSMPSQSIEPRNTRWVVVGSTKPPNSAASGRRASMLLTGKASLTGTRSRRTGGTETSIVAATRSGTTTKDKLIDSDSSTPGMA